ncbi:hypothetical protein GGI20_005578, partial [Coemansia sp. BCRC 34301]
MPSESFLQNHLLYLLCSLLGVVASRTLAVVDAVSNWWHAAVCALLSLLPKACVRFPVNRPANHYHPAVLVTGTSSGIGHDTAVALASSGYTVFAGVRSWEDGARVESDFLAAVHNCAQPSIVVNGHSSAQPPLAVVNGRNPSQQPSDTDTDTDSSSIESKQHISDAVTGPRHMLQRRLRRMHRRRAVSPLLRATPDTTATASTSTTNCDSGCIIPVILDVICCDSIDRAYARVAEELEQRNIPLVAVVNNAGVTAFGPMDISAPS